MRAVRYLLRIGGLVSAGGAVFFGLVLLLNAQVLLNRYAELYMMDTTGSSAGVPTNSVSAYAPAGLEPMHESRARPTHPKPAPPAAGSKAGNTSSAQMAEPQATSPATMAKSEAAGVIYVSNAESIAGLEASDRRVDVVLTPNPGTSAAVSEVVLENVRVLTIELVAAENGTGERSAVHAVTLDVDADTAQNLLLASQAGKLSLTVHRERDHRRAAEARESASPGVVEIPQAVTTSPVADTPQQAVSTQPVPDTPQHDVDTMPIAEPSQAVGTPPVADVPPRAVTASPVADKPQQAVDIPQEVSRPPVAGQHDDPNFTLVTVRHFGGRSDTYKVPRER